MARNRFNTRASYDNTYKYGESELSQKSHRVITHEQTEFLKKLYSNKFINNWEKNFIKSVLKSNSLSEKQVQTIKKIHNKIK